MSINNQSLSNNPIVPLQRVGLHTTLTNLILDSDSTDSSLLVETNSNVSLYIDKYSNIGINTSNPTAQCEIASSNGSCLRLRYGSSTTAFANIFMNTNGNLSINPNTSGSEINTSASINLSNHNGSTTGLKLGGVLVLATAAQLNYTTVTAGSASASKALVLDSTGNITGINSLSSSNLLGTIQTASQPNITSLGTLSSLTISGNLTINGNLSFNGEESNFSNLAYLSDVIQGTAASSKALIFDSNINITGINSLGTSTIIINGSSISSEAAYLSGVVAGSASNSKVLVLNNSGAIAGISLLSATNLSGTLQTSSQPNITSIGTLGTLTVSGSAVLSSTLDALGSTNGGALTISGGLAVAKNAFIGSNLTIGGNLYVNGTQTVINSTSMSIEDNTLMLNASPSATGDSGILINRYQTANDTSSGSVVSDTSSFTTTVSAATTTMVMIGSGSTVDNYYQGWWVKIGNMVRQVQSYVGITKTLTVVTPFTITPTNGSSIFFYNHSYASFIWNEANKQFLAAYTAHDSTSTLTILDNANIGAANIKATSSVDSTSIITGSITTNGGVGISKTLYVGTGIYGDLQTANQPNITSLGTLLSLNVSGEVVASTLTGTLQTATQPNITSLGTLSSLNVSGGIVASTLTGTLQTAAQPNITTIGTLTALTIGTTTLRSAEASYLTNITVGTASASKALVLDSSKSISGISSMSITGTNNIFNLTNSAANSYVSQTFTSDTYSLSVGVNGTTSTTNAGTAYIYYNGAYRVLINNSGQVSLGTNTFGYQLNLGGSINATTYHLNGSVLNFSGLSYITGITPGAASNSQAIVLNSSGSITGITSLGATTIVVNGFSISSEAAYISGVSPGTAANNKALVLNSSGGISGITSLTTTTLVLGTTSLTTTNAGYISGITVGTATASKALVLDSTSNITGINTLTATTLAGTLSTAAQPNITSIGTLTNLTLSGGVSGVSTLSLSGALTSTLSTASTTNTSGSLKLSGGIGISNTTNATSSTNGGTFTSAGGGAFAKSLYVGSSINAASLSIGGTNSSAPSWLTTGIQSSMIGTTFTNSSTAASGNAQSAVISSIGQSIIAATNTGVTTTNASSLYIAGPPIAGVNNTITNPYSLWIPTGNVLFGGNQFISQSTNSGDMITLTTTTAGSRNTIKFINDVQTWEFGSRGSISSPGSSMYLYDNNSAAFRLVVAPSSGNVGINTVAPVYQLSINSNNGSCLRLIYGNSSGTETNYADITVTNTGELTLSPNNASVNISGHNGSTIGLKLNSVLITSTATQLNYTNVTAGIATASKALILDSNSSISGINSLTSITLTGTLSTAAQPNITSHGTLTGLTVSGATVFTNTTDATSSTAGGSFTSSGGGAFAKSLYVGTNLIVGGTTITSTQAGYISGIITTGTAIANKALVLDGSKNITGINCLCLGSSTDTNRYLSILNGSLAAGATMYNITYGQSTSLNNQAEIAFSYIGSGNTSNSLSFGFFSNTNIFKISADQTIDVPHHNGSTTGLKLGGTLVTATATQLNYTTVTAGTASASKALVLDGSSSITGINSLTATTLVGTLSTAVQTSITSVGTLTSLSLSGALTSTLSTASTTNTSGSLKLAGGIGISLTTDAISATNGGTFTSAGGGAFAKSLYVGTSIDIGGTNITAASWLTSGIQSQLHGATITIDNGTASNAIVSSAVISSIGQSTIAATNTGVTTTNAASLYIAGPPNAGTNMNITNSYSLWLRGSQLISTASAGPALLTLSNTSSGGLSNILFNSNAQSWELGTRGSANGFGPNSSFYLYDITVGAFRFVVLPTNGNIGINTSVPTYQLDVGGSFNATSYNLSGTSIAIDALTGVVAGTGLANKALVLDSSKNITGISALGLTGTLTSSLATGSTSNATGAVKLAGGIGISLTTNATSSTNGGTFTSAGGGAFAKSLFVGLNVTAGAAVNCASLTSSGDIYSDGNMIVSGAGQMIIGSTPEPLNYPLYVSISSTNSISNYAFLRTASPQTGTNTSSGSQSYSAYFAGRIVCNGEVDVISDRRTKRDINVLKIDYCKKFISTSQPISFRYKGDDSKLNFGYIAQDLYKAGFENLVSLVAKKDLKEEVDEDGFINPEGYSFSVSTSEIIPILTVAIKDLYEENKELKTKNNQLEQKMKDLETRFKQLEDIVKISLSIV